MRASFPEFYSPSKEEIFNLWHSGQFVFDTNVLLDLYRLPTDSYKEFVEAMRKLDGRYWVPFQVGLEFQRSRLSVIHAEKEKLRAAVADIQGRFSSIDSTLTDLQIEKRIEKRVFTATEKKLNDAKDSVISLIQSIHSDQLEISSRDPIRDAIDELFSGKIGSPPSDQDALNSMISDGGFRYENQIPPGFADSIKDKDVRGSSFVHNGIRYESKYGDVILWKQLLHHCRSNSIKEIALVTSDRKEDWWWREKGKTIGPRPELVREISEIGGVSKFWMLSSKNFLTGAKEHLRASVSKASLQNLDSLEELTQLDRKHHDVGKTRWDSILKKQLSTLRSSGPKPQWSLDAVRKWSAREFNEILETTIFPDMVATEKGALVGIEVLAVNSNPGQSYTIDLDVTAHRFSELLSRDRISRAIIVVVMKFEDYNRNLGMSDFVDATETHFSLMRGAYDPRVSTTLGVADIDAGFIPIVA